MEQLDVESAKVCDVRARFGYWVTLAVTNIVNCMGKIAITKSEGHGKNNLSNVSEPPIFSWMSMGTSRTRVVFAQLPIPC